METLIKKLFGAINKKKETKIMRISVEEAPMLIEKEFLIKKGALEEFTAKKLSECKYLHSKSADLLQLITTRELDSKENQRLNKAAQTSKTQLQNQLKKLLIKIDPTNRGHTLNDARSYSGESAATLTAEIITFRKNIAFTSYYLKDEMRSLGEILQELLNNFVEMNTTYSKATDLFEFEKTKLIIGEVIQKKKKLNNLCADKKVLLEQINSVEKKIFEQKEKLVEKQKGPEFLLGKKLEEEMNKLMNEKQEQKTEISALLLSIDRPLARFKQLVDSGRWRIPAEEKEMLEQFITNPILALKKDPRADIFKRVLSEIVKAIEEGDIELKAREKEKRLEALQELINFDFFGKVFWKMNEIQKKQNELNQKIQENNTKKNIDKEEGLLKDLQRQLNDLNQKKSLIENEQNKAQREITQDLNTIKDFTQKILGKTILFEEE